MRSVNVWLRGHLKFIENNGKKRTATRKPSDFSILTFGNILHIHTLPLLYYLLGKTFIVHTNSTNIQNVMTRTKKLSTLQ